MKVIKKILSVLLFCLPIWLYAQQEATFKLEYDNVTETYKVSMRTNTTYNPPTSIMASSSQVSIVVPHVAGGWQVTNFTPLTAVTWSNPPAYVDGTALGLTNDYIFFAPTNSVAITIPANTYVDLFSFKSGSGCVGDLSLFDNVNDPLNGFPSYNADNNMVILAAGGNIYVGNDSGNVACSLPCTAAAGILSY